MTHFDELVSLYGIHDRDERDDFKVEYEKHGLHYHENFLLCGKYLLHVKRTESKRPVVIKVPDCVEVIAQNAFKDINNAVGIFLPPNLKLANTEKTFLPNGLDWIVLHKLEQPNYIVRLFRGINGYERGKGMEAYPFTIFYMGNIHEAAQVGKSFGIKELSVSSIGFYSETPANAYGGWYFNRNGKPCWYRLSETMDSVILFNSEKYKDNDLACMLRALNPNFSLCAGLEVKCGEKIYTDGYQVFDTSCEKDLFGFARRFAHVLELGNYFEIRVTDKRGEFALYEVVTQTRERIHKGNFTYVRNFSKANDKEVSIATGESHSIGHYPYMMLGLMLRTIPKLREVRNADYSVKTD